MDIYYSKLIISFSLSSIFELYTSQKTTDSHSMSIHTEINSILFISLKPTKAKGEAIEIEAYSRSSTGNGELNAS